MRLHRLAILGILFGLSGAALAAGAADSDPLHPSWLDTGVSPAQNFYQYANGGWRKSHAIPAAYSSWSTFNILQIRNERIIRQLIQDAAKGHAAPGSAAQKVGDFYASGMDEKLIEQVGMGSLSPEFDGISGIRNLADLEREVAHLQMIGVDAMFGVGEMQDFKDSTKVIGVVGQAGLGLPDRDYYLKQDPKFKQTRALYVAHLTRTFHLLGDGQELAAREAAIVMAIETRLAAASMSRIEQRNPRAIYHVMNLVELDQSTPNFSWRDYFREIGYPGIESINLAMPKFFGALGKNLRSVPLEQWKVYLRWRLIDAFAPYLSKPFVDEDFSDAVGAERYAEAVAPLAARRQRRERCARLRDRPALRAEGVPALLQGGGTRDPAQHPRGTEERYGDALLDGSGDPPGGDRQARPHG